jgi:hypothetical protein
MASISLSAARLHPSNRNRGKHPTWMSSRRTFVSGRSGLRTTLAASRGSPTASLRGCDCHLAVRNRAYFDFENLQIMLRPRRGHHVRFEKMRVFANGEAVLLDHWHSIGRMLSFVRSR